MKYSLLLFIVLLFNYLNAQEIVSPLKYNPYQNPDFSYSPHHDKSTLVIENLIYQFDTLDLPFKDDFSSNHFPSLSADTTNASKVTISMLLRNGSPIDPSEKFSTDTSFSYTVYAPDSLGQAVPNASETITVVDFSVFPFKFVDTTVWPAYSVYDTLPGGIDTVFFSSPDLVQKKITKYLLPKDSNIYWTDHFVYLNDDFPVDPPSVGVSTFDGLDENGLPYDFDANVSGNADQMTSVPINISNITKADSLYLSFFYQPQGISPDNPNNGDSLVLDFYNVSSQTWEKVWGLNGNIDLQPFEEVFVFVDSIFYSNAFQFRFRNKANLSGDFDQWHLDYIHLGKDRTRFDTTKKDVTFIYDAPSFIKDYTSMPWFHYKLDPIGYTKDSIILCFRNRFHQSLNVYYQLDVTNIEDNFEYFHYPVQTNTFAIVNGSSVRCQDYSFGKSPSLFASKIRSNDFDDEEIIQARYSLDFRPASTETKDFFPSNDTINTQQVFSNHYSYDDGTAEAGYGINNFPENVLLNYFQMPISDSLVAINIYFLPQAFNVSKEKFKIVVYNSLSESGLIYESSQEFQPIYTKNNEFASYALDSLIVVGKDFYVGVKAMGSKSLNIGYDFNLANKSKIFRRYAEDEPFFNPGPGITEGSLMIRPIFRKLKVKVGLSEEQDPFNQVKVFPNPTTGLLNIKHLPENSQIRIFNNMGNLIYEGEGEETINLESFAAGFYYMQMSTRDRKATHTEKIILTSH